MDQQRISPLRIGSLERRTILLIGDFSVGVIALVVALVFWAANAEWLGFSIEFLNERVSIWFYLLPFAWLLLMVDLYDVNKAANWRKTVRGVVISASKMLAYFEQVDALTVRAGAGLPCYST